MEISWNFVSLKKWEPWDVCVCVCVCVCVSLRKHEISVASLNRQEGMAPQPRHTTLKFLFYRDIGIKASDLFYFESLLLSVPCCKWLHVVWLVHGMNDNKQNSDSGGPHLSDTGHSICTRPLTSNTAPMKYNTDVLGHCVIYGSLENLINWFLSVWHLSVVIVWTAWQVIWPPQ